MKKPVYLDNQATTPLDPKALETMLPYFTEKFGNASSRHHEFGWEAEAAVEHARAQVARIIGAQEREIIFTSGATESNNLAILGAARSYQDQGKHIICSSVDHASVLACFEALRAEGFDVTFLPVDPTGKVPLETLKAALRPDTILVSIIHANNEVGTINNIAELGKLCQENDILFHTDASQSVGKIGVHVDRDHVDLMSISSHKMYGPKGVGALYVRQKHHKVYLKPVVFGGGHEQGLRAGTLNVPLIVGLGKACELAQALMPEEQIRLAGLRETLLQGLTTNLVGIQVNGHLTDHLNGNLNIQIHGVQGSALMMAVKSVAFSSASACSESHGKPSHVLQAMGLTDDQAACSVRFGIGRFTTHEEILFTIEKITQAVKELRRLSPVYTETTL